MATVTYDVGQELYKLNNILESWYENGHCNLMPYTLSPKTNSTTTTAKVLGSSGIRVSNSANEAYSRAMINVQLKVGATYYIKCKIHTYVTTGEAYVAYGSSDDLSHFTRCMGDGTSINTKDKWIKSGNFTISDQYQNMASSNGRVTLHFGCTHKTPAKGYADFTEIMLVEVGKPAIEPMTYYPPPAVSSNIIDCGARYAIDNLTRNWFSGKNGVVFGTSISNNERTSTGGYLTYLSQYSNINFCGSNNYAIGGAGLFPHPKDTPKYSILYQIVKFGESGGFKNKDIALIEGFTNDYSTRPFPLGNYTDECGIGLLSSNTSYDTLINSIINAVKNNNEDLDCYGGSICGRLRAAIRYIKSKNPSIEIYVILDHYGTYFDSSFNDYGYTASKISTLNYKSKLVNEEESKGIDVLWNRYFNNSSWPVYYKTVNKNKVVRSKVNSTSFDHTTQYAFYEQLAKACESLSVPVIKLYAMANISELTEKDEAGNKAHNYLVDAIHPSVKGQQKIASLIWQYMLSHQPLIIN